MTNINVSKEIERLIKYALKNNMIDPLDIIPSRNALLDFFHCKEPYYDEVPEENLKSPVDILNKLLDYSYEIGLLSENTITYRDLLDTKIMALLMPRQSEVVKNFIKTRDEKGIKNATDDYYALSRASNYIRVDRIEKNLYWQTPTDFGNFEITINLSKPEKDPKEIAAAKLIPQANYPKCLLCVENVGFAGTLNHPARQNHRVIPLSLLGEQWYFQYSPYVYYNEHCIVFNGNHTPMKINDKTFKRLLDFEAQFPHYFIGSNADLPIVGGSILTHDHFQGGNHVFPMEVAPVHTKFSSTAYSGVNLGIVKWPMSVIRISSKDKEKIIELSCKILEQWKSYSDEALNILAFTDEEGNKTPHNTITPIARINKAGEFEMDLVLRNNRTSEEYPDGIFHPHKELHHIKKENIGLIEVMGLAVLPARLNTELKLIENVLTGSLTDFKAEKSLGKHIEWIEELIKKYGTDCSREAAEKYVQNEVGFKFLQVLSDAGVFKTDASGLAGINRFVETLGFDII